MKIQWSKEVQVFFTKDGKEQTKIFKDAAIYRRWFYENEKSVSNVRVQRM